MDKKQRELVYCMKIDLHVHSSEVSQCGKLSAQETVRLYKEAGFDAIVLSNHFNRDTAEHFARHGQPDFNAVYHEGYQIAKDAGDACGLTVLCGYELRFDGSNNDYLVFGMSRELAADWDTLFRIGPGAFGRLAREQGILFYQAHPFRNHMKIIDPAYLFGMEVKNGNPRHDSRNDIAAFWAEKFGLHKIGGSDCHEITDVGVSGIETDLSVTSMEDLVAVLREDRYSIL